MPLTALDGLCLLVDTHHNLLLLSNHGGKLKLKTQLRNTNAQKHTSEVKIADASVVSAFFFPFLDRARLGGVHCDHEMLKIDRSGVGLFRRPTINMVFFLFNLPWPIYLHTSHSSENCIHVSLSL